MEKIDKMATTVQHIETICDKIYKPEIVLTPIERAFVFTVLREKLWSIVKEAEPLLPLPKRSPGRPFNSTSMRDSITKAQQRDIEILKDFDWEYNPEERNSEGVYRGLAERYMLDNGEEYTDNTRRQVMRCVENGRKFFEKINEQMEKNTRRPPLSDDQRKMNKIFLQGMAELETIKCRKK